MTLVSVRNSTELMSALSNAVGGDTIELAAGDYGVLNLKDLAFSSDVTIISANPANPAIIRDLTMKRDIHIVFDGILFNYNAGSGDPDWIRPFSVENSSFITFRNSVFDGDEIPYGNGTGLRAKYSDNIVIENNEVFAFYRGITLGICTNVIVRDNDIHTVALDGINFVSANGLLIEGNWIHDFRRGPSGHSDMIQSWTTVDRVGSKNVTIRGNFLDAGKGSNTQSIFLRNEILDRGQGSFAAYAYQNIMIEDNVIYNNHTHGITMGQTDVLTIRNNTLLFDPNTTSEGALSPKIKMSSASLNVVVDSNITADVADWTTMTSQPGWIVGNNLLVQYASTSAANYYGDLFVNPFSTDASLADLRALPGGLIEIIDGGAAMTRFDLPMVVGPYAAVTVVEPPVTEPEDPVDPVDPPVDPLPGVCEALLAEALTVVADLEAQLAATQLVLTAMTGERDAARAERDTAIVALSDTEAELDAMTTLWGETVDLLVSAEDALAVVQGELNVEVAKLDAIRDIVGP